VEAWLATIEPRVIDAWLAFCKLEPEAFGAGQKQAATANKEWLEPQEAEAYFAKRMRR